MNAANFKTNKGRKLGKYLMIAGILSAIFIIILISTGIVSLNDLVGIHFKLIEICPFCM